jgi:hypothetical protein
MPGRRRKDREPLNELVGTIATVPTATGDIPSLVGSLAELTHDDIACRVYQFYEERAGEQVSTGRTGFRQNANCDSSCFRTASREAESIMPSPESLVARVRGEYLEMPGLRLTFAQACRLWQLDAPACEMLLEQLVREAFLRKTLDGAYIAFA